MSKKVKCLNCSQCMRFAVPSKKVLEESPYMADRLKNCLVCGWTMKTKGVDHEQYCKQYREAEELLVKINSKEMYDKKFD